MFKLACTLKGLTNLFSGSARCIGCRSVSSSPMIATSHFLSFLLKLFPLIRCEHFLQPLISLAANLFESRLRFFSKRLKLLSCVPQYLMDLRFLVRVKLKRIKHLLEAVLSGCFSAAPAPSLITIQGKSAGCKTEQENYYHRPPNLPFAFVGDVHTLPHRLFFSVVDRIEHLSIG
jgi:hypothetical protein